MAFSCGLLAFVLLGLVAGSLASESVVKRAIPGIEECIEKCPQDCGMTKDERGCSICHCGVNPFSKPPPPLRPGTGKEDCLRECPQDCGMTRNPRGCAICNCSVNPFSKPPPPPRPRGKRDAEEAAAREKRQYGGGGRACSLALPLCRPPCKLLYDQKCPRCSC